MSYNDMTALSDFLDVAINEVAAVPNISHRLHGLLARVCNETIQRANSQERTES
jgi:hypothetical protein